MQSLILFQPFWIKKKNEPSHLIPLVEVVPHPSTFPSTTEISMKFLTEIGQKPILVKKEIASFIVNRLQGAVLNEAVKLFQEGYISVEDLDKTFKDGLGLRWSFMGPFETIDLNAPKGIRDYCERYKGGYERFADEQVYGKWEQIEEMEKERRNFLKEEDIPKRCEWRNKRLMGLMRHKLEALKKEEMK